MLLNSFFWQSSSVSLIVNTDQKKDINFSFSSNLYFFQFNVLFLWVFLSMFCFFLLGKIMLEKESTNFKSLVICMIFSIFLIIFYSIVYVNIFSNNYGYIDLYGMIIMNVFICFILYKAALVFLIYFFCLLFKVDFKLVMNFF
jgi:hypothetical protein